MELLYYGIALALGLYVLLWSADKFVDGSSAVATRLGMSKLLVGMIIVGFGTSAPSAYRRTSAYRLSPAWIPSFLQNPYQRNLQGLLRR